MDGADGIRIIRLNNSNIRKITLIYLNVDVIIHVV